MVLLWLVGRWGHDADVRIPSGDKRVRLSNVLARLSQGDSTGAMKLLESRLASCGLNRFACEEIQGKVVALLDVAPVTVPDGVLGVLGLEQRFSWLLNERSDMAFNQIKGLIPLEQPAPAVVIGHATRAGRTMFQLQAAFAERLGGAAVTESADNMRQHLQRGGYLEAADTMPVVAVQVWRPLAYLMCKGLWSDFSFPARMPSAVVSERALQSVRCLLEAQAMEWGRQPLNTSSPQYSLDPSHFRHWSDMIRTWAAVLRPQITLEDIANTRLSMELLVSTFERQADVLEAVRSGMFECKRWGFQRYDLVFLIRCLFLCSDLRSDSMLRHALVSSLHILFQGGVGGEANYFLRILQDTDFPLPSPATLGHMRFVMDVVLMLQRRQFHEQVFADSDSNPALFFLLDSSPQGNVNWLMIEYFLVEGDMLAALCVKAWRLRALGGIDWEQDPDEDRVSEERSIVQELSNIVQHHVLPPVGLGSGRSSLQHELHAFLHAMFLETGCFSLMCRMAQQTTATASDKGTEAGIQQAPRLSLREFLRFAQGEPLIPDGDSEHDVERNMLDFKQSLGIHALQHFVNNCTKGIADAMPSFWEDVYPGMNALVNCLSAKFFRQRFTATCLTSADAKVWHGKFEEGYSSNLVGWRFGSLAACNKALLSYEYPLRQFWDDDKLSFRNVQHLQQGGQGEQGDQAPAPHPVPRPHSQKPEGPNVSLASQACRSKSFWAWQHMFGKIGNIVDHMMRWLQSCPCHDLRETGWGPRSHEFTKRLSMDAGSAVHQCPLTGFRAAEIACGKFSDWIAMVVDMELAEISLSLEGCSPAERASVLADCQAARQHIVFAVQAELCCWELTPRIFIGISHADETLARQVALSGLQQWWAMSDEDKACAHNLTKRFCQPGPLNSELLEFVAGRPRCELARVMQEAGRLLLVPVNEISVERLHAQTHKQLKRASHAGAVAISWGQRSPKF